MPINDEGNQEGNKEKELIEDEGEFNHFRDGFQTLKIDEE